MAATPFQERILGNRVSRTFLKILNMNFSIEKFTYDKRTLLIPGQNSPGKKEVF
jgi:hypothetical protein